MRLHACRAFFSIAVVTCTSSGCGDSGTGSGGAGGGGTTATSTSASSTGSGLMGDFSCIGKVMLAKAPGASGIVQLNIRGGFGLNGAVEGASIDLCPKSDPTCATPIATIMSDVSGNADATVPFGPNGFDGFGVATKAGFYTSILQGSLPYVPLFGRVGYAMAPKANIDSLLASSFGITLDPAKGHVLIYAEDCQGKNSAGATITASGNTPGASYYMTDNGQPDPSLKATSAGGAWLAVNVPPGTLDLTLAYDGKTAGHATALVRASAITQLFFNPTP